MIKLVYCVRRRADLDPEAFRKYWLEQHGPLVQQHAKALRARRYVQSHTLDSPMNEVVRQPRGAPEPYDGITEVWWDSLEDLLAAQQTPEGQAANLALAQDESRFVDLSRSALFFTTEFAIFEG
jgi:uncharacterized protein (TIGR02118 family)